MNSRLRDEFATVPQNHTQNTYQHTELIPLIVTSGTEQRGMNRQRLRLPSSRKVLPSHCFTEHRQELRTISQTKGTEMLKSSKMPIPVSARSKAWVSGRSLARITRFESHWKHKCLSLVGVALVRQRFLRSADPSSGGVLLNVVCLRVVSKPQQLGGLAPRRAVAEH